MTPAERNQLAEEIAVEMYAVRWEKAPLMPKLDDADERTQAEYRAMAWRALGLCEKGLVVIEPAPADEEASRDSYLAAPDPAIDDYIPF